MPAINVKRDRAEITGAMALLAQAKADKARAEVAEEMATAQLEKLGVSLYDLGSVDLLDRYRCDGEAEDGEGCATLVRKPYPFREGEKLFCDKCRKQQPSPKPVAAEPPNDIPF